MRGVHCIHCSSDDVEFKADILVGCCEHKSGEIWHCNNCGEEMTIETVYSDDEFDVNCPHKASDTNGQAREGHSCGSSKNPLGGCAGCGGCEKKN